MSVVRELFGEIVDYAGLFPPASLPLDEVVTNYDSYMNSDSAWMLARLILPVGRIDEFAELPAFDNSRNQWKISGLIPSVDANHGAFDKAITEIQKFNSQYADSAKAVIDTVEIKAPTTKNIEDTISNMPSAINAFLEIPHQDDPTEHIAAASNGGDNIFAKIRTGGVTPELIPSATEIARFISQCAQRDLGFKATAGLHHPLRGEYRLTYKDNPECGNMFGFVNVFVAACFAFTGTTDNEILEQILTETSADAFELTDDELRWNENTVPDVIGSIRRKKAISFGSCSFTEPTTELAELGWPVQLNTT